MIKKGWIGRYLEPENGYTQATLALAYHFNNINVERDKLLKQAKSDSAKMEYFKYVSLT